jgi:hypothetical protein
MDMKQSSGGLTLTEEAFLQALLWEEGHLVRGAATCTAEEHGLSLLRCLEVANRLSPNLQGPALNRLRESACPAAVWPWGELSGEDVLRLLWWRLSETSAGAQQGREATMGT